MARNLTEDEVKFIEERRKQQAEQQERDVFESKMSEEELGAIDQRRQEQQAAGLQRRVDAMHAAAADWRKGQRDREAAERDHWDDVYRQNHGGFSKAEMQAFGPDGSIAQRKNMMRAMELRAAREHEAGMQGKEMETRLKVAEQNRLGMENQGVGAATVRANADKDILGQNLADKEKQRQHELEMQGRTQTFQGTQAEAERRNRFDIADVQADAQENTARIQAEAQEARLYAENLMKTRNLDQRQAMQFARMREQKINKIMEQRRNKVTGKYSITREDAAKLADEELENQGLPGTARKMLADFGA